MRKVLEKVWEYIQFPFLCIIGFVYFVFFFEDDDLPF